MALHLPQSNGYTLHHTLNRASALNIVTTKTHMVLYETSMFSPFKTRLAFFPLPYCLYTPLTLTARADAIFPAV